MKMPTEMIRCEGPTAFGLSRSHQTNTSDQWSSVVAPIAITALCFLEPAGRSEFLALIVCTISLSMRETFLSASNITLTRYVGELSCEIANKDAKL